MLRRMSKVVGMLLCAALAVAVACDSEDPVPCDINGDPVVELGVPDLNTFVEFEPLEEGGDIPLWASAETFLGAQLALRATNMGDLAYVDATVTHVPPTGPPRTSSTDSSFVMRLFCRDDGHRYLVPVSIPAYPLGDDAELDGQPVDVSMTVTDVDGRQASATASGILRRF